MALADTIKPPVKAPISYEVRRFELPDLDFHAKWFFPRFLREYPHLNERSAVGFLKSLLYSNECLFLFQEKGVALAQLVGSGGLEPEPIIWERFVWVEDPTDRAQVEAAGVFYPRFVKWATQLGINVIHVANKSDVPRDTIKAMTSRVYETQQFYLKVRP